MFHEYSHSPLPLMDATHSLKLTDGRKLAYTDLGDPQGYPIIFGHGMPGCRLEGHYFHHQAKRQGFRILTPDRPGIGESDYQDHRTLLDYPDDIQEFADTLGLQRFSHVGWSSGGSRTLACCYKLGERIDLGVCLSGYTNFSEYEGTHRLIEATRWPGPQLARLSPGLMRLLVHVVAWFSRRYPGLYMREAGQLVSEQDKRLLRHFLAEELFRKDQMGCLASGGKAIATDLLTELADWGFRLSQVHTPVFIYLGEQDPFIPIDYARHLVANLPDSELTLMPETGHLYPLAEAFQNQLFSRIRKHLNTL
jgi:pimeloyl-ACP methyl ester carboxylesterase